MMMMMCGIYIMCIICLSFSIGRSISKHIRSLKTALLLSLFIIIIIIIYNIDGIGGK